MPFNTKWLSERLSSNDERGFTMACPDNVTVGYDQLIWVEGTGSNKRWYPAKCIAINSGSGTSANLNLEIYPEAGGTLTRTSKTYSQNGVTGYWTCVDTFEPSGFPRG